MDHSPCLRLSFQQISFFEELSKISKGDHLFEVLIKLLPPLIYENQLVHDRLIRSHKLHGLFLALHLRIYEVFDELLQSMNIRVIRWLDYFKRISIKTDRLTVIVAWSTRLDSLFRNNF